MTHSDLVKVEVQGADISVAMRGTCFRVKYRKQEAPWLIAREYGPDDPDAKISLSEFRALAWAAANDKGLGSYRSRPGCYAEKLVCPSWLATPNFGRT